MDRHQRKLVRRINFINRISMKNGGKQVAKLLKIYNRIIFGCDIGIGAVIPTSTVFHHCALGCTIGNNTIIGENCQLYTNVTLGTKNINIADGNPIIGNNVTIGTGAIVLGKVYIGDNSIIGAGAVVLQDMPPNALIVGNPAKVKKIYG